MTDDPDIGYKRLRLRRRHQSVL